MDRPLLRALTFLILAGVPDGSSGEILSNPGSGPWTVGDIARQESASGWTVSPDGRLAVWVRSTVEKVGGEEKRVANLWWTRLDEAKSFPLTRGTDTVSGPAFSPDGRRVAFLSSRPLPGAEKEKEGEVGKEQVWAIPMEAGEARPLTRFDRDIRAFGWIDPETIVVLAPESPSAWERERRERKDTTVVVEDAEREPPVRLFRVSVEEGTVRRLTRNRGWIDSLAVSPDGRRAVVRVQRSLSYEFDQRHPPRTYLVDLATGAMTRILQDGLLLPVEVRWTADSSGFYIANEYTRHPTYRMATVTELHYFDVRRGVVSKVDLDWDRGLGGAFLPAPGGVLGLLAEGVRYRPARYEKTRGGWRRRDLQGTHVRNMDRWELSRDGRTLVYRYSAANVPPQWYVARLEGSRIAGERKVTDLNPGYSGKPTGRVEVIRWSGAGGETVEGILQYPLEWREGERYPLILDIHGGPASADRDSWDQRWAAPSILWRQRGAFVLQVNYHGSSGYGLDWVESIGNGRYYELEIPDIERGVDSLISRGLIDPDRLACSGWSNGGILAAELITRTSRYRAASIGAADVEWFSDWGNVDFGAAFDNYYLGASPLENPQIYMEKSPFFRLPGVTTPTLVFTGTEDRNVPPSQSWSLFRALQQAGKTDVRFVLFPGEAHGLKKIAHQRRKMEEDLAWFGKYLFGSPDEAGESIREGSLLAGLLQRGRAARVGRAFGKVVNGTVVPETVRFRGLEVGRFEVTRSQFAAFDPAVEVPPGKENLPMTGVSFDRAREYLEWLAGITGLVYRLPTQAEAEDLVKAAGESGNTLDRWAGYSPNPEDAERITAALSRLPGRAPLLLPVGSLPGCGEDPVFDLDGNAAEWARGEEGRGVVVGPSADRPRDPRGGASPPGAAYTGFRVVRDPQGGEAGGV